MRRLPGQAARHLAGLVHNLAHVAMALVVLAGVLLAAGAWRLSRGPVDLPWLTDRIEAAVNDSGAPTRLSIGSTALAWEGFSVGVDRPLDLRLTDVQVIDPDGRRQVDVPRAEVSLSILALLEGRIALRAVELDDAHVTLHRAPDGATSVDLGSLEEQTDSAAPEPQGATAGSPITTLLKELVQPATNDRGRARGLFGQLQRVRITNASVDIIDRQVGATWHAPHAAIDLTRREAGGVDGSAVLTLALGDQTATLDVAATLASGAAETHLRMRLSPVAPAALARAAPRLASLDAMDAPVGIDVSLDLGPDLQPERGRVTVHVGSGSALVGTSRIAVQDAVLVASGTPDAISLESVKVALLGHPGGTPTVMSAAGTVRHADGRYDAALTLDVDQMAAADLGHLWPDGFRGGARPWLLENITAGVAHDAHVTVALAATEDLSNVMVTRTSGGLRADGLTVHWLRPLPPVEGASAQIQIVDPDTLDIRFLSGHERIGQAGLSLKNGGMRITGLSQHDQYGLIQMGITGSVADAIVLLKEPRLQLLDRHPIDLRDPAGDASVALLVAIPLESKVRIEDIAIHALGHLTGVHLGGLVAGRDLDQGVLDLDATSEGLGVKGRALVAGIATQLDGAMDFRMGPPTQIVQRVSASARPGAGQLVAAGLDPNGTLFGEVPVTAVYTQRRAGNGEIAVTADFTPATLAVPPTLWRKPVGVAAQGSATVLLDHDKLAGIDRIAIEGDGISFHGTAQAAGGQIVSVRLDRALFGHTDVHGSVQMAPDQPIAAMLAGSSLDLAAQLTAKTPKKPKTEPPPGPAWRLDARLDRVLLAGDRSASAVVAHAENDGRVMQVLRVTGTTGAGPFTVAISRQSGARQLHVSAADAGALLRGLDIVRVMEGGTLAIEGRYDDRVAGHPLTGTAEINDYRVRGAVGLAKLLQAMTLYGLVDVLRGPGIGFSRLIAPFRYDDDGLVLNDARAFSPSLGLTAKGRIDLASEQIDVEGTIVPAYFFNSLLGNIPLVGRLFSPERGGGVFAARYALTGPLEDPSVSVNPLSALTPGFLREIFGLF